MIQDPYYLAPCLSNSGMSHLKLSPRHYKDALNQSYDSPALVFGRLFHMAVLEPEKYQEHVRVFNGDRRTKAGKEAYADLVSSGFEIISADDADKIDAMRDSVRSEFTITGKTEIPKFWTDEDTSAACKAKADLLQDRIVWDLKSTIGDAGGFGRAIEKYDYDRQAAFYMDGFGADGFGWIVVEKSPPYGVMLYRATPETLMRGRDKYKPLAALYAQCVLLDEWPGYSREIQYI